MSLCPSPIPNMLIIIFWRVYPLSSKHLPVQHDKADDSIVAIKVRTSKDGEYFSISGEATRQLEGVYTVKAQPVSAITNADYFLESIARCEKRLCEMRNDGSLASLLEKPKS